MDVATMTTSIAMVLSMGAAEVEPVAENQLLLTLHDGERFRITVEEDDE